MLISKAPAPVVQRAILEVPCASVALCVVLCKTRNQLALSSVGFKLPVAKEDSEGGDVHRHVVHFISSIQWSHSGEKLLTSAYDNIARVWSM